MSEALSNIVYLVIAAMALAMAAWKALALFVMRHRHWP